MELVLPMNYYELEQEEMMYLDGGEWVSESAAKSALKQIGITSPALALGAALTISVMTGAVKKLSKFSGVLGIIAGLVLGFIGDQVKNIIQGLGFATTKGGANIYWSWNIFAPGVQFGK